MILTVGRSAYTIIQGVEALLSGGMRAMFMSVYFSQAKIDAEKSDISAAYRITEAFGKFLGKCE